MPYTRNPHGRRYGYVPDQAPLPFNRGERVAVDLGEKGRDFGTIREVLLSSRRAVVDTDHHGRRIVPYDKLRESHEPLPKRQTIADSLGAERRA